MYFEDLSYGMDYGTVEGKQFSARKGVGIWFLNNSHVCLRTTTTTAKITEYKGEAQTSLWAGVGLGENE